MRYRKVALKFDRKFKEKIEEGAKNTTIRYDLDEEIQEGDYLEIQDDEGHWFQCGVVTDVVETNASKAIREVHRMRGKYGSNSTEGLLQNLNKYYSENISHSTPVTVIKFSIKRAWECQCGGFRPDWEYHSDEFCGTMEMAEEYYVPGGIPETE